MAGGGSKPIEIKTKFDPRETTLREVVNLYAKDARAAERKIEGFEKIFDSPGLKEMLDRPAIDMFEGSWDGDLNPLEAALQGKAESTHRAVISAVSNIQRNVIREATRLKTGSDLIEITKTVYIPPKSKAYTKSFGYNPYNIGFLTESLVQHVKDNPADKPIANAIMFQLQTGLRPSAVGGLPTLSFKQSERPGGSPGIFIPKGMPGVKTDNNINIPLSRRSIAILQDQSLYNEQEFGESSGFFVKRVGNNLEPITDKDINKVLRKLGSSFGIKKDLKTVDTKDVPYLTSYDLRRLNATAFDQLGVDINKAGALVGRPIQANTEQSRYIGAAPGVYGDSATKDVNKLSNFFHQQYAETVSGITEAKQEGKTLSLNTMLFDNEPREFANIETEAPAPVKINVYDVGSDVQVEKKGKATVQKKVTDDLTPTPNPEARASLESKGFNARGMADGLLEILGKTGKKALLAIGPAATAITFAQEKEAGATTAEAIGTTIKEDLTPYGVAEAAVEPAVEAVGEEIQRQEPDEGFLSGMTRAMTGRGMGTNYSLGGFLDR